MLDASSNTPPPPREPINRRAVVAGVIALVVLGAILAYAIVTGGNAADTNASASSTSASATTTSPSTSQAAQSKAACQDGLPKIKIDRDRTAAEFAAVPGGTPTVESFNKALKEWPQFLAYRASNPLLAEVRPDKKKLWENGADWEQLVNADETCLNSKGVKLLREMEQTYELAVADENGKVPGNWFNSGIDRNGPVLNTKAGIPANKQDAIEFTFPNGKKDYSMHHCGNYGLPAPSGIPQVPFTPDAPPTPVNPPVVCVGDHCNPEPPCVGPQCFPCPPGTVGIPPNCIPVCTECCTGECPPPPVCPPGMHGTPPACKDDHTNGPGQVVDVPQRPNPLPARPDLAEPTTPDVPRPTVPYTPPAPAPVTPVPQDQGGPTAIPTPRETPTPEAEAPTEEEPEEACIPAPGMPC